METNFNLDEYLSSTLGAINEATQNVLVVPFDVARTAYANSVRFGFVRNSLIATAKFFNVLSRIESLMLGPFARSV